MLIKIMSDDTILLSFSLVGILGGLTGLGYLGYKNNYLDFLKYRHWVSLLILIFAGIITWVAMVWIVNPNFSVTKNQWISLGFSIGISFLWWGRYTYTVIDDEEETP